METDLSVYRAKSPGEGRVDMWRSTHFCAKGEVLQTRTIKYGNIEGRLRVWV